MIGGELKVSGTFFLTISSFCVISSFYASSQATMFWWWRVIWKEEAKAGISGKHVNSSWTRKL